VTRENPWLETVTFDRRTGHNVLLSVGNSIYEKLFCIIGWEFNWLSRCLNKKSFININDNNNHICLEYANL